MSGAQVIDTHAHLDSSAFDGDRDEVIRRAREAGVVHIINPGTGVSASQAAIALAEASPVIYAAVGIHPHDTETFTEATAEKLRVLAAHPRVVAIGEIGLDFYRDYSPRDAQEEAFRVQLALAGRLDKPVIVHDREAHTEVLEALGQWSATSARPNREHHTAGDHVPDGVLHCFSGTLDMALEAIDLGFYIGIDGPVTFRRASRLRALVRELPLDSLVIETDCPYLTPEPFRGRRNEPAHVCLVAQAVAEAKGLSFEEVATTTTANALRLFRLQE
jgi:TatD DNase family protein